MLKVLFSIGKLERTSEEELLEIMTLKRNKRGGFDNKIFLESIENDKQGD